MTQKYMKLARYAAPLALLAPYVSFAATDDLSAFNNAMASGTNDGVSMLGTFGTQGIVLIIAAIAAGVVIMLILLGARRGKKAIKGKF